MRKTFPNLDPNTQREVNAAVVIMHQAFEEAAQQVDARFPHADPESRKEMIAETGREIIETAALALEYDETTDNVSEGLVANMLRNAVNPRPL